MNASPSGTRLEQQLQFLAEIDKLKNVLRRTMVSETKRQENSAEHSWHLALLALFLAEHAAASSVEISHVIKMVLIHDIVEIDAGDTFCYDTAGNTTKTDREERAAQRLFSLLPSDQAAEIRSLWDEFEQGTTPEAALAQALDRLQPLLQNLRTEGTSWRAHGITKAQVLERNKKVGEALPTLWQELRLQLDRAEEAGYFTPKA